MKGRQGNRRHAVRVAAVATLVVMVFYVVAAVVLNLIVTNHLIGATDNRLRDRLNRRSPTDSRRAGVHTARRCHRSRRCSRAPLVHRPFRHGDCADSDGPAAPTAALGFGSGHTPHRALDVPFRLVADARCAAGCGPEHGIHFECPVGALGGRTRLRGILAAVVFVGATVVGLRASAPSELFRRRQAEFTADASHELRTPISVIEAEVGLALDRPRDTVAYQAVLERVRRESARLRRIVEDLLWLARADSEEPQPDDNDLADVGAVAQGCVERFGAVAAAHRVDLTLHRVGNGPFVVQAKPDLVDRLAGVLIDNACKFAGEGGRVEVSVRDWATRVDLRVDDSGPGIPDDQRDAVFDRFHRASDTVAGTGLGLAIADSVVRSTQGQWAIGVAELGGARLEVSWRKVPVRKERPKQSGETLSESLA